MHWNLTGRLKFQILIFYKIIKFRVRRYSKSYINDICILSGVRTPIGSFQGKLSSLSAVELGSQALNAAVNKSGVERSAISEFLLGNVFSIGCGQGLAYQIAMNAGLADTVVHSTVNKLCGSGLKAIINGCQILSTNCQELIAVGGAESTSNVPYIFHRSQKSLGNLLIKDILLNDGLIDPYDQIDVTGFAEETVKKYKYTRDDFDTFALESYARAANAQKKNIFSAEIIPVVVKLRKGSEETVCEDEEIGRLNIAKFRNLKPELKDGTITPGNTSGLGDGAAMIILASGNYVLKKNLKPLAKVVSYADGSTHRKEFVMAPSIAIRKALSRANLNPEDIHMWEISETFAVTSLLNAKLLNVDISKVNINGGTISLGHPFGMTGIRLVLHLALNLPSGMFGCASISHGTGGGSAVVIQKF